MQLMVNKLLANNDDSLLKANNNRTVREEGTNEAIPHKSHGFFISCDYNLRCQQISQDEANFVPFIGIKDKKL
ncbi:CLUMA_CG000757, isoform A [Clunio marinus]|uniref:CLUMA_CG000757, isoform A n=1 Tax=Clunio marinus TaxID=568069 RepID=A0A1J1HHQ0_9DIPT|nr:CLUMA_CG000757, isoform A [Clunio marinus]